MEPKDQGKGTSSAWRQGGPGKASVREQAKGTPLVPCRVVGWLCEGFAVGRVILRKDLLPQKEPSSSFSKGPRPIKITSGVKVVPSTTCRSHSSLVWWEPLKLQGDRC